MALYHARKWIHLKNSFEYYPREHFYGTLPPTDPFLEGKFRVLVLLDTGSQILIRLPWHWKFSSPTTSLVGESSIHKKKQLQLITLCQLQIGCSPSNRRKRCAVNESRNNPRRNKEWKTRPQIHRGYTHTQNNIIISGNYQLNFLKTFFSEINPKDKTTGR